MKNFICKMLDKFMFKQVSKKSFKIIRKMMEEKLTLPVVSKNNIKNINSPDGCGFKYHWPYRGNEWVFVKHINDYIIVWNHYIRGSVCKIYKAQDYIDAQNKPEKHFPKSIIEYADQTTQYGFLLGVNDILINQPKEYRKFLHQLKRLK